MQITYRTASANDAVAMGEARARGGWAGGAEPPVMARYLTGEHSPQHALPERTAILAEAGEHVVGYVAGHLTHRLACEGELQWLYVLPEWRGTPVARTLLSELASWFVTHDARRICVNVAPDNGRARAFYARHGAEELNPFWLVWTDIGAQLTA